MTDQTIEQALAELKEAARSADAVSREETEVRNRLSKARAAETLAREATAKTVCKILGHHDAKSLVYQMAKELKLEVIDHVGPPPSKVLAALVSLVALIEQHDGGTPSVITDRVENVKRELKL